MNIQDYELRDIRSYLYRHGYTSSQISNQIIVDDPVLFNTGPDKTRKYTDVVIKDWPAAIKFIEERS